MALDLRKTMRFSPFLWLGLCLGLMSKAAPAQGRPALRASVVKIHVTTQAGDYLQPWQAGRPGGGTGTGFIVQRKRILTNAHVISNARNIYITKEDRARRYRATLLFVAHDCDLALLTVEDEAFFDGTVPLPFARSLPELDDEVVVMGYPMGGDRLSVTRGVVSRVDYSTYSHSAIDRHLVLQVDAAINPGNSGGPVLFNKRVVGLAFQGIAWADNIGYAIPLPVINRFLADIEDGAYHGYPELGVATLDLQNPALRAEVDLAPGRTGVLVSRLDPYGSAAGRLRGGDVLLSIDEHRIANDGTIQLNGNRVMLDEMLERKQQGEAVAFSVWRDGAESRIDVPLVASPDRFLFRRQYDQRPRYVIRGGLVFSPLSRETLRRLRATRGNDNARDLFYYADYAKRDGWHENRDEFVVFLARMPDEVNTYAQPFEQLLVESINDRFIARLDDVATAFEHPLNGYHVLRFVEHADALVVDANRAREREAAILKAYGVPAATHLGEAVP